MMKQMLMALAIATLFSANVLIAILIYKQLNPTSIEQTATTNTQEEALAPVEYKEGDPMDYDLEEDDILDDLEGVWETEPTYAEDVGYGSVEGVVTWQYNDFVGTKGDVNAKIFLVPTTVDFSLVSLEDVQNFFTEGYALTNARSYFTKADGYGNYSFRQIPEGSYVLIMLSANTFNMKNEISQEALLVLQPLLQDHWDWFYESRLLTWKHFVKQIYVTENQAQTVSHDFGYKM